MEIRVLGPLELSQDGRAGAPSAPKPRSTLALLLLLADRPVAPGALVQELWADSPPASAHTTLQTYIVALRKLLCQLLGVPAAVVSHSVLVTTPTGYLFRAAQHSYDRRSFDQLAAAGRQALAAGDAETAAAQLGRATALWRGPALADVKLGPLAGPQVKALEDARLAAVEQSMEARLRLGRHHDVLPELTALLSQHRLHEALHAQLMIALHRSGRRQEALAVFQRLRQCMVAELGMEPSRRLHQLQQAILTDDPGLAPPRGQRGPYRLLDAVLPPGVR